MVGRDSKAEAQFFLPLSCLYCAIFRPPRHDVHIHAIVETKVCNHLGSYTQLAPRLWLPVNVILSLFGLWQYLPYAVYLIFNFVERHIQQTSKLDGDTVTF